VVQDWREAISISQTMIKRGGKQWCWSRRRRRVTMGGRLDRRDGVYAKPTTLGYRLSQSSNVGDEQEDVSTRSRGTGGMEGTLFYDAGCWHVAKGKEYTHTATNVTH
jgi:hypothetical protein